MRFSFLGAFGGALLCGAILAACGGGGGNSSLPSANPISGHGATAPGTGTRLVVTIHRGSNKLPASLRRRIAAKGSHRMYVSSTTEGLQVSVSGTGIASQTIYADVSNGSPLCTTAGDAATCTITVPTLAATETIDVLETDQAPQGSTNGYGTGFATGTNILASLSKTVNLQLGQPNAIALNPGMVTAVVADGTFALYFGLLTPPTSLPSVSSANFGFDNSNTIARIVTTNGVAAVGLVAPIAVDFDCGNESYTVATPAPYSDVNGSPEPITMTANSAHVTLASIINNGTPPPAGGYATTAQFANDGYTWFQDILLLAAVNVDASFPAGTSATIVVNNNLSVPNPFSSPAASYASSYSYAVTTISASSYSLSAAANGTTTVTGTDSGATDGLGAESVYAASDANCNTGVGVTLATVTSSGPIDTTSWQEPFTVTAGASTGTCTFYLYDSEAETVTKPITLTIN